MKRCVPSRVVRLACMAPLVAAIGCAGMGSGQARAQSPRPMTVADLDRIDSVGSPALSPDGTQIAYTLSSTDAQANERTTVIMLAPTTGGEPRELVEGGSPQWSPDGTRLAYKAEDEDGEGSALWLYDLDAGEPRWLTRIHQTDHFLGHRARKNYQWSPDGARIAFVGADPPPDEKPGSDVMVFDRILYKTRTGFSDNRSTHLWVVDVDGPSAGEPRCLTADRYDDHSLTWSPDGDRIAYISNHTANPDDNHQNDLWTVDVDSGSITRLTRTVGTEFAPTWSPDGRWIAHLATRRPVNTKDSPPENTKLFVIDATDGGAAPQRIAADFDRRISSCQWAPDGDALLFRAGDRGSSMIYVVGLMPDDEPRVITARGQMARSFDVAPRGGLLAYTRSAPTAPTEIWAQSPGQEAGAALTSHTAAIAGELDLQDAEPFWFDSWDGTPVQGWLIKPVDFRRGGKHPLILVIHGGPHGMYGESFSTTFQLLASAGYGVCYINPRGSTGYGQGFADGTINNWGGGDYKDLMAGLDHAIATNHWIDPNALGVMGGSYGGFMTNWVITQTDRFDAAVAIASLSNLISFYGTSLYQLLIETEFPGEVWENFDLLWHFSPLRHVENVTTPTLFLHGAVDHDVPIQQAEEMYIALKKLGVETVLVRYPDEGHGVRQPAHRADYYRRILDWFDTHVR